MSRDIVLAISKLFSSRIQYKAARFFTSSEREREKLVGCNEKKCIDL